MATPTDWRIYRGDGKTDSARLAQRPAAPAWREFATLASNRAEKFKPPKGVVEAVNAAIYLRRPVLVTGDPGTGKSSLAFAVAHELGLGDVLSWNVNSRSTVTHGLYDYDALARLRAANLQKLLHDVPKTLDPVEEAVTTDRAESHGTTDGPRHRPIADPEDIGAFITLGAIGTAFLTPKGKPRVVLIDEIDKSDVDLPNDLLHVFENGQFEIPELVRIAADRKTVQVRTLDRQLVTISGGVVPCMEFPIVVITSNGERDLPPAFLRRCLRIDLPRPTAAELREIVKAHFPTTDLTALDELLKLFDARRKSGMLATDQLLNAFFLVTRGRTMTVEDRAVIENVVLRELDSR
jgi:MoxR-like ATPase